MEALRLGNGAITERDGIVVTVQSDGITGVGEASPMAATMSMSEAIGATWDSLKERVIPAVVSMRPKSLDDVCGVLEAVGGDASARAGVESAFYDVEAQRVGMPLARLLGGSRMRIECGLTVGTAPSVSELMAHIERHLADGYKRVTVTVHPGWDIEPLGEIRRAFGDIPLIADANGAYTREHFDHLRRFDEYELLMIVQPLMSHDLEGHAELQALLATPVCLDEGAEDPEAVRRALRIGACRIVKIRTQRVGGPRNAWRIHDLCASAGIPVWVGSKLELGVGSVQAAHLAALPNCRFPSDVQASRRWFVEDVITPPVEVHDGEIQLPLATGLGYRISERAMEKFAVRPEVVVSSPPNSEIRSPISDL